MLTRPRRRHLLGIEIPWIFEHAARVRHVRAVEIQIQDRLGDVVVAADIHSGTLYRLGKPVPEQRSQQPRIRQVQVHVMLQKRKSVEVAGEVDVASNKPFEHAEPVERENVIASARAVEVDPQRLS